MLISTVPIKNEDKMQNIHILISTHTKFSHSIQHSEIFGRSQNTVPIASAQVAIKGIAQHSTRVAVAGLVS